MCVCSQVSYSIILDSVCHMLYLCKVLWVMELVCDVCSLGGVGCEFWRHSLFTLCHYALYCIADCSSCRFLSTLRMVRMFPVGCRCVVVYPDTPIHTGTQLEKSSPSPKTIKIRVVRIFPGGCRCVMVYPDTPIHTGTQLEKSSPSPKSTKIHVNYNQQYKIVHSDTSDLHQHSVNSERCHNSQRTSPRGQTSHTNSMTHKTMHRYNM